MNKSKIPKKNKELRQKLFIINLHANKCLPFSEHIVLKIGNFLKTGGIYWDLVGYVTYDNVCMAISHMKCAYQ